MSDAPCMMSVYVGRRCAGFIMSRGKSGYEAFNVDNASLGTFRTAREAADAISNSSASPTFAGQGAPRAFRGTTKTTEQKDQVK